MSGTLEFSEFKDMLKFELGERTDLESHTDLGNLLGKWVNSAYRRITGAARIYNLTANWFFPDLITDATDDTVDGTAYIEKPSDAVFIYHCYDTTNNRKLNNISLKKYIKYTDRSDTDKEGKPYEWVRHQGSYIYLHPTPDDAYTIRMYYKKRVTDMSADDDTTAIDPEWDDIILKLAVVDSLYRIKEYDEAKQQKELFMEMVNEVVGLYDDETRDRLTIMKPSPIYYDSRYR